MSLVREAEDWVNGHASKLRSNVKSGLNKRGFSALFGLDILQHGRAQIASGVQSARSARLGVGGYGMDAAKAAGSGFLEGSSLGRGGGLGTTAWDFFSGAGMQSGMGRAGAIGARAALTYGALQAADFLNPFGFGSIRD